MLDISILDHGPYFSEDKTGQAVTVTSDCYVHTVNEFLFNKLRYHGIDLATV
jgi:hypothetical protein